MSLPHVLAFQKLLDRLDVNGHAVAEVLAACGPAEVSVERVEFEGRCVDFVRAIVTGSNGRRRGGTAPTLGVVGQVGGIGARPTVAGLVSDGDGVVVAMAAIAKLAEAAGYGEPCAGDVVATTHICPFSPTIPHVPVPLMAAPCEMSVLAEYEVLAEMEAVLAVDTTRGNRILNAVGVAITPTVKEGYILRVSESLLDMVSWVTGRLPLVLPLTTQDITPYGNGIYHLNSIMQPAVATSAPVVGVALTAQSVVPGSSAGSSCVEVLEPAARFVVAVARAFGQGSCALYDEDEYRRILSLYGSLAHLQR